MRKRVLIAIAVLTAVAGLFIFIRAGHSMYTVNPGDYDAASDRAYWIGAINKKGAVDAYASFVDENTKTPSVGVRHIRAHVIGDALFETQGIEGISICDSSFGFGCFHGLFTVGFASQGQTFISEANEICLEQYGPLGAGCQHGIGHGIVEYVGHDNLVSALELCEETTQPTPLLGCTSGVFMEHNTPFTVLPGEEPLAPYPYSEERPYGACEEVPEEYQASCYYELGGWWQVVLGGNQIKMGKLCSRLSDPELRDMCALGVGNIVGPTNAYDVERSSAVCLQMPESVVTLCHAGAAWSMFSNPAYTDRGVRVCNTLAEPQKSVCVGSFDLANTDSIR